MRVRRMVALGGALLVLAGCTAGGGTGESSSGPSPAAANGSASAAAPADPALAAEVMDVVDTFKEQNHLRAVLVKVTRGDDTIVEQAVGESMTGVPATTDMYFRNGAVAISYMSTLLLILVDEGTVSLDDKVSTWLPDIPHADQVTLGQLAQMTSGYVDFEATPELTAQLYANPFKQWTPQEQLALAVNQPLWYAPGTNWNYAHTNYVILGQALEKITRKPLDQELRERVLTPLGLDGTSGNDGTPAIPEPALHAFTSERRQTLDVPASAPFYEESTYWNPSWTLAQGAIQTTDLDDLAATGRLIGSGKLLTPESYQKFVTTDLRGKTTAVPNCPDCIPQSVGYSYGLGIVTSGDWVLQNPMFAGESAVFAYLPAQDVVVAVAVTYQPEAFDPTTGNYTNQADQLWREIAAKVVPDNPPPIKKG